MIFHERSRFATCRSKQTFTVSEKGFRKFSGSPFVCFDYFILGSDQEKELLLVLCRSLVLKSLHAQADLLILAVEIYYLSSDHLANFQDV